MSSAALSSGEVPDQGPVVVNGVPQQIPLVVCSRCVQDSTVPGIEFSDDGTCNFCSLHDQLESVFPAGTEGAALLEGQLARVRREGRNKKYDCVVGVSGGRDSTYTLWCCLKKWGLRPLAVHFNDGFDNPVAGGNMVRACETLGVELRTVTSDWRESRELKIAFLKASVPDLNLGTDIGIAAALFGVAAREGVRTILIGQSFRTEGIKPLSWSFFDGTYLRSVQKLFSAEPPGRWRADAPGFHLGPLELFYYSVVRRIRVLTPLYYCDYVRQEAEKPLRDELGWIYPGAHYFDDLYHSLIKYVHRVKFGIDLNMNSDSALVRSGQMTRSEALERAHGIYSIEDPEVIDLCIKRLGLTRQDFDGFMALPPRTFRDYRTSYGLLRLGRPLVWLLCRSGLLPRITYDKYFRCGK